MDVKHVPDEQLETSEAKRQKVDDTKGSTRQPLISDEQRLWTALAEPPDIDYTGLIEYHADKIDKLLKDHRLPYKERCAWYEFTDTVELEIRLLGTYYGNWTNQKLKTVRNAADSEYRKKQEDFYLGLKQEIHNDWLLVDVDYWEMFHRLYQMQNEREEDAKRAAERAEDKETGPESERHSESASEGYVTAAESVASPRSDASVDTP